MDGLSEMLRQPEGMAMVLSFLALLVTVMAAFYGALERAALARRLAAIEADMEERDGSLSMLTGRPAPDIREDEESPDDALPPGIRFV